MSTVETALMLTVAQIIEGEAPCAYCDDDARLTIATGADPEPEPVCGTHGLELLDATRGITAKLFGREASLA